MLRTVSNIAIFGVVGVCLLGVLLANADNDLNMNVDGLRCDSCGRECTVVCGSRQFRTCCFNYIKKRGDPSLTRGSPAKQERIRSIPEDIYLAQDVPSLAYVLTGPQMYVSDLQDRESGLRNQAIARQRKPSLDNF